MFKKICFAVLSCIGAFAWSESKFEYIEPSMVNIPAGVLSLSVDDNREHDYDVNIKSLMVSKYEVTNKEFRLFVEDSGYNVPEKCMHEINERWYSKGPTAGSWENNNLSQREFEPVTCIGWQAATDYALWLSKKSGKHYRLLSETEWMYAAQGGQKTPFYLSEGDDEQRVCEYANIADQTAVFEAEARYGAPYQYDGYNNPTEQCDDKVGFLSIVGMYKANPFGLYDMVGNITEFVQDCENKDANQRPADGLPELSGDCSKRAFKGGSWHWKPWPIDNPSYLPIHFVGSIEGFRLARELSAEARHSDAQKEKSTIVFEKALRQVQDREHQRRSALASIQTLPSPKGLKLTQLSATEVELNWEKVSHNNVRYRIYRGQFLDTNAYSLIAKGLKSTQFIDRTLPEGKKAVYMVKAIGERAISENNPIVMGEDIYHPVPGKVEAEFASQQKGTIASIGAEASNIGWINEGDWLAFSIDVKEAGEYEITYQIATPKAGEIIELSLNGEYMHSLSVDATGSYTEWGAFASKVTLPQGKHSLKISAKRSGWNIDWVELVKTH